MIRQAKNAASLGPLEAGQACEPSDPAGKRTGSLVDPVAQRSLQAQAALGFVFGLNAEILKKEAETAAWLFDLLEKLGQEDDAYHATVLVMMEYSNAAAAPDDDEQPEEGIPQQPGVEPEEDVLPAVEGDVDQTIARLPKVNIRLNATPAALDPGRFLATMVDRVLKATPVTMHREARKRRAEANQG